MAGRQRRLGYIAHSKGDALRVDSACLCLVNGLAGYVDASYLVTVVV